MKYNINCPHCGKELRRYRRLSGSIWVCPTHGTINEESVLRPNANVDEGKNRRAPKRSRAVKKWRRKK